jgi:hypothetical protein
MRSYGSLAVTAALLVAAGSAQAQDAARSVAGGGISVQGWQGRVDPGEAANGQTVNNARLSGTPQALQVTTGPAIVYWNPSNTATGSYTVKATFNEPEYMNLNNHPHPYGIFIGGNDMGTDQQSLLYCAAYGNGRFIVRGFGPAPFAVNGQRPEANAAVHSAAGKGQPVTQEIAVTVTADNVSCSVNGTVVGTYPKSAIVGEGKLKSTDGVWGVRFAHNTEGTVTGLAMTRN